MSACILIVDDNPVNLKLARSVLEIEGHKVDAAIDAESALEYLHETIPDLILMDIALPGMDGLSLTRKLKADPRWRTIPVIALTAFAMLSDEKRALDAGCDGYMTKPIDTRQLPLTVLSHLVGNGAS
ncbi:response regulator [Dokdonella sp.]|uniref:response regulator n=1 Tax=Dokdonella sp. TaxID=2291710 RepID=UPI003C3C72F7